MDSTTFVIDDDRAVRESLMFLLRAESIRARAFGSASSFLAQLRPEESGCVVTDVRMPEMDGIMLMTRLRDLGCALPIIVLTGHADVPLAVQAMKAGAVDFIEKPYDGDLLLRSVRRCLAASEDLQTRHAEARLIEGRIQTLTERETEVFLAIVEGCSNKEAAIRLNISPRTVEVHRSNVMAKLKAQSLSDLVRMGLSKLH